MKLRSTAVSFMIPRLCLVNLTTIVLPARVQFRMSSHMGRSHT